MSSENSNEFWEKIKRLELRRNSQIPKEVYDQNGVIETDEQYVLNKWKMDFECFYNNDKENNFDSHFQREALSHKAVLEDNILDPLYESNTELNQNMSMEEIEKIVMNTKNGKSTGIDSIPYKVLKFPTVTQVLCSLFQLIFDTSLIPSTWRKAIIYPSLKDPCSDQRMPMNYGGISLLCCVSKNVYCANKQQTHILLGRK